MNGWEEILNRTLDRDSANQEGLVRRYLVKGYDAYEIVMSPETVLGGPGGDQGLPVMGDRLFAEALATLERYVILTTSRTEDGAILHEVEGQYSNDRRWRAAPPVNRTLPGVQRPTFYKERLIFDIPYAELTKVTTTTGGQSNERDVYDFSGRVRRVRHTVFKRVITVTIADWNAGMLDLIEAQNDRVHKFGSKWYRFESGDAIPVDDSTSAYEIEYIWERDPGTVRIGFQPSGSPPPIAYPPKAWNVQSGGNATFQLGGGGFVRPPFHILVPVVSPLGVEFVPFFDAFTPYVFDADGWQNLPGIGG